MDATQRKRIEELYLEMYDMMMLFARSNLESEAVAEEAIQETFRIACQKPASLCDSPNPQGWLVNTLRNTVLNMLRSRATAKRVVEYYLIGESKEFAVSEDHLSFNILYEDLVDTEEFRLLSEMVLEGRSHEEMAASRGISISACKKRVQRAKRFLQRKISI